jgi:hypothetical protein
MGRLGKPFRELWRYFGQHWSGQLTLARSFWVNGVALHLLLTLWSLQLARYMRDANTNNLRVFVVGWIACLALVGVWQWVGIWRAGAKSHVVARVLARCWVVASVVPLIVLAVDDLTATWLATDEMGPYSVRVLGKPEEAEFSGTLNAGAANAVVALLNAHPRVRFLHMTSPGGLANEGLRLAREVRKRHLRVIVDSSCISACTLVFVAGEQRLVRDRARLGFHRPHAAGGTDSLGRNELGDLLEDVGASQRFITHVENTPSYELWWPSQKRLLDEHVVTRVVPDNELVYCPPFETADETRHHFEQVGALAAMRVVDSARFERVVLDYMAGPMRGATLSELDALMTKHQNAVFREALCHPAVAAVREWARYRSRLDTTVASRFPNRCGDVMSGLVDTTGFSQEEQHDRESSIRDLIVASLRAPSPEPTESETSSARAAHHLKLSPPTEATIAAWHKHAALGAPELCSALVEYDRTMAELEPAQIVARIRSCR